MTRNPTPERRVVIVDDVASSGRLLQAKLAESIRGLDITVHTDPNAALATLAQRRVDLVIADYVMPGLDGVEFIRRFRLSPERDEVPVIMITSLDDTNVLSQAFDAGANDFMSKSVSHAELIARVTNMLALRNRSIALAEKNRRLYELATTDPLTKCFNRRHFLEFTLRKLAEMRRTTTPFSVLLFDADHFKQINDNFGHAGGDAALIALVDRCRSIVREVDQIGRMGGEEFAIILSDTRIEGAALLAERLRASISEMPIAFESQEIRVTISSGVTEARLEDRDLEEILRRADSGLYKAKNGGRNRVEAI